MKECPECGEKLSSRDMMKIRCPYCDEVIDEDPSYHYRGDDSELYY